MTPKQWQARRRRQKAKGTYFDTLYWQSGRTIALDMICSIGEPFVKLDTNKKKAKYVFNVYFSGQKVLFSNDIDWQEKEEKYTVWWSSKEKTRMVPWEHQDYFDDKTEVTEFVKEQYTFTTVEYRRHKRRNDYSRI